MIRKTYPGDLNDKEWARIEPLIPAAKKGGRPRTANMREGLNAIFYVLKTGCQWDMLPHDFPPKGTVYHYFNQWSRWDVGADERQIARPSSLGSGARSHSKCRNHR
jgi:putative transposase